MKILQVCAVDFTLYHFLVPLIDGLRSAGHEVVASCSDGPLVDKVRERGIRVETIPFRRGFLHFGEHAAAYRHMRALLEAEKFDFVHVHTPVAALIGRLAAWRARVPTVVYTAHGFYFHDRMPWLKWAVYVALEWLGGRLTDVLFTQAEEDAASGRRLHLCRGGRIAAIGNGVDAARFTPDGGEARARIRGEIGVDDARPVILVVGRLVGEKGYPELFEAMRAVDAELWVAGERLTSDHADDIGPQIEAVKADPVLSSRIRFLGYRGDMPDLLRAADIFTLPSHREGMPRSIIEAMMVGLPVVATDIRGSREEVVAEQTGFIVPVRAPDALAAALNRLVGDSDLRARMGIAGRMRAVELYDESVVIARQLELLGLSERAVVQTSPRTRVSDSTTLSTSASSMAGNSGKDRA
ncbi:MAG: glycosyltransferase family 1 protein [Rhodospirillaceae bacterium]|nr:glycosyltransferase family 1 protein [Rhodospirillaceae bacterium]